MSFEEGLKRLEAISEMIRNSDVPLEEAMRLYEEGIKISSLLDKELNSFERKIEILVNKPNENGDGEVKIENYPDES